MVESVDKLLERKDGLEVSVVMPCLNEEDTLEACILKAREGLAKGQIQGEIIVADNGSTDSSREIAQRLGARVVPVTKRGYGNALMGGIEASRGRFIIMADADDSYDFREIPKFVAPLREGNDLVQGCRLPGGGGRVMPGAMPWLHRWVGNPFFTQLAKLMFGTRINDINCGFRGFTKKFYSDLDLRCTGMEFATEMVIKGNLYRHRIVEIPITLHPDGRKTHPPHLRTFRDGWRTLRFYLLFSPRWVFVLPGLLMILLGLLGYAVAFPGLKIGSATFDVHTLLIASLSILLGYQAILFGIFSKTFAIQEGLLPPDPRLKYFFPVNRVEQGLLGGLLLVVVGLGLIAIPAWNWLRGGFGPLDYTTNMRWIIPGFTLTSLGFLTVLASFLVGVLGLSRK